MRDEFKDYIDALGYLNPHPINPNTIHNCDNSLMFTSEYYMILKNRGELTPRDATNWKILVETSMPQPGLLARYPGDTGQDGPDNMVAVLGAAASLNKPDIARQILDYGLKHFGFFNNENPRSFKGKNGKINWEAFLWRQFQLAFAAASASGWYNNAVIPLAILLGLFIFPLMPSLLNGLILALVLSVYTPQLLFLPLELFTALVIATSCWRVPTSDTDARRLAWSLIQATQNSFLCKLAARIWTARLYKDYPEGMNSVAEMYYQPLGSNPYAKYWVL